MIPFLGTFVAHDRCYTSFHDSRDKRVSVALPLVIRLQAVEQSGDQFLFQLFPILRSEAVTTDELSHLASYDSELEWAESIWVGILARVQNIAPRIGSGSVSERDWR